jgi:hypothetical protein
VSSPILDSRQPDLATAKDLLARLERCAEAFRSTRSDSLPWAMPGESILPTTVPTIVVDDFQPHDVRRRRWDPATADLFPYDLAATIVGCVVTVTAFLALAVPLAIVITSALVVGGEYSRRRRWFPSAGLNLIIGVVAGLIFVLTA